MTTTTARGERWRIAAAVLACACLALLATELALRWLAPIHLTGIQHAYQHDAQLGFRAKPGVHMLETTDHQQEIRTNRLGTINFQEDFSAYPVRVFALGDSYTQGTGLPSDASYPFQLDMMLNMSTGGRYERRFAIVNLGLAAFGGKQSLITLKRYSDEIGRPHIVLYLGAENDADDDAMFKRGDRHRHLIDGNPSYGPMLGPMRWLASTEIGKRLKLLRLNWMQRSRAVPPSSTDVAAPAASVAEQQRSVLERLLAETRARDARLIVSWSHAPSSSYQWLRRWAGDNGVAFADWLPSAQSVKAANSELPWHNPHSGGHLRTWVNQMIARAYAREILRLDQP